MPTTSIPVKSEIGPIISPVDLPFGKNIKISDDPGQENQDEVSIASDIDGNLYAGWNDNRYGGGTAQYQCAFSGSTDGGKTWTKNELYRGPEPECGDPVVVSDLKGGLYRLGMSFNRNADTAHLMVSMSKDGGLTWGQWHTAVDSTGSGGFNDKPWMAAYGDSVYVTWTLFGNGEIMFIRSNDGGANWSSMKPIGNGQGSCIVTDSSGRIYAGWGVSTISFRSSTNGGDSFSATRDIGIGGQGGVNPRSAPLPGCAVDPTGKHLYYVWAGDTGGGSEDIWITHSGDGGSTWSTQVKVNDDNNNARQIMPWVAIDAANVSHVGWTDWRNGVVDAYYSNSSDGGSSWVQNIRVTDSAGPSRNFQGDYQGIAVTPQGRAVFAWCDTRANEDIYVAYADVAKPVQGLKKLVRIDVEPKNATITADQTQQFNATGYDKDNNVMNVSFVWSANGGSIDQAGLFTPKKTGKFTVMASAKGIKDTTSIIVTPGAPVDLTVTPKNPSITTDQTQQFSATGVDAKGNPAPINATWSTNGGSISASGLYSPQKVGSFQVIASSGSLSANSSITVAAGKLAKLVITPSDAKMTADDTLQFSVRGLDAKDNPLIVNVTWNASGGSISSTGLFSPTKIGEFKVTVTSGNISASTGVEVTPGKVANATILPRNATLQEGNQVNFSIVSAFDAKGNPILISNLTITWSVENGTMGSVSANGQFTAKTAGISRVVAEVSDARGSVMVRAEVNVTAKPRPPSQPQDVTAYAMVLVIAMIAVALFTIILRRRRKKNMVEEAKRAEKEKASPGRSKEEESSKEKSSEPPEPIKD
jgi:hypothetical protein